MIKLLSQLLPAVAAVCVVQAAPAWAQASQDVVVMRIPIARPNAAPRPPAYAGGGCGPLVRGWTVKGGATRLSDVSFGTASDNAERARNICNRRISGAGSCFITASADNPGLSTVFIATSGTLVRATDADQQFASVCNPK